MLKDIPFTAFDVNAVTEKVEQVTPTRLSDIQVLVTGLPDLLQKPEFVGATIFFAAEAVSSVSPAERLEIDEIIQNNLGVKYQPNSFSGIPVDPYGAVAHENDHYAVLRQLRPEVANLGIPIYVTLHQGYARSKIDYYLSAGVVNHRKIMETMTPIEHIRVRLAPSAPSAGDKVGVQVVLGQLERQGDLTEEIAHQVLALAASKVTQDIDGTLKPLTFPELDIYLELGRNSKSRSRK